MRTILPKRAKIGRLLRWAFYLIVGLLIAQMLWNILSWSWSNGDYTNLIFILGLILAVAVVVYMDRRLRPEDKLHVLRPWKIPDTTTRGVLWLIAGFNALTTLAVFCVCMIPLWLLSKSDAAAALAMVGLLLFLSLPYGYWHVRRLYDRVQVGEGVGRPSGSAAFQGRVLLSYKGYSEISLRENLTIVVLTFVVISALVFLAIRLSG